MKSKTVTLALTENELVTILDAIAHLRDAEDDVEVTELCDSIVAKIDATEGK